MDSLEAMVLKEKRVFKNNLLDYSSRSGLKEYYLDYVNNYLTIEKYAENNSLTVEQAKILIDLGRDICNATIENVI